MIELPSRDELRRKYRYNPSTGDIARLDNGRRAFATVMKGEGYLRGKLGKSCVRAHRVAWKMHYGTEPEEIDHINGDRADNRIINLRSVSHTENQRNRRRPRNNTSGFTGVSWSPREQQWRVQIGSGGKRIQVGSFDCIGEAVAARRAAERGLGYLIKNQDFKS